MQRPIFRGPYIISMYTTDMFLLLVSELRHDDLRMMIADKLMPTACSQLQQRASTPQIAT